MDDASRIRKEREAWEAEQGEGRERRERFERSGGEEWRRLYTPLELEGKEQLEEVGFPGRFPFTRGVHGTMHRGRFWTMRQYAGFGTARETNLRFRYLLDRGQTGLSTAFDLPTQMGYDSDHPLAGGEVGKVGVAISSIEDMERLFEEIPLEQVSTSMTINSTAIILLAFYLAVARRRGDDWTKLRGTIQNDILKEYVARGTYVFPPEPSLRIVTDLFEFGSREVPRWNTISVSGYHIREAGSSAVQEVAFTLGNGREYLRAATARGLDVDAFAPRVSFFFNAHNRLIEEVAKYRAARRLWARIVRDEFGAKDPRSWMLRFHAQTAGSTLTLQQPGVNVVRVTLQALAAVLGGCQSLHTNSRDEAMGLPTEDAVRIALRTQQVLAEESGVGDVADPLGGSYAVESVTDEIEAGARETLERIEELGGMLHCIQSGWVQEQIHDMAYRTQLRIEAGDEVVVGVNAYQEDSSEPLPILRVDPALEPEQCERLRAFREGRDAKAVGERLAGVDAAARSGANLVAPVVEAVDIGATLGEISDTLRGVFGTHREVASP